MWCDFYDLNSYLYVDASCPIALPTHRKHWNEHKISLPESKLKPDLGTNLLPNLNQPQLQYTPNFKPIISMKFYPFHRAIESNFFFLVKIHFFQPHAKFHEPNKRIHQFKTRLFQEHPIFWV
jgi:hypothetical protein